MIFRGEDMEVIYYICIFSWVIVGIVLIKEAICYRKRRVNIKFRSNRFRKIKYKFLNSIHEEDDYFKGTGIPLNLFQYNMIRISILSIFFIFEIMGESFSRVLIMKCVIYIFAVIITSPRLTLFNKKSLFAHMISILQSQYQKKLDEEIYKALLQLKNLAIVQKEQPVSADFIIEQISRFTTVTKKIFLKTISMMREGRDEDAVEFFKSSTGTKLGNEFANMLAKLEKLNPAELEEQLVLLQSAFRNEKVTDKLRRQEMLSNILFIPIVAVSIVILLNFVIITVWLDSFYRMLNL